MKNQTESDVMFNVKHLSADELEELYDIEIYDDGTVYDTLENMDFESLTDWATFYISTENEENIGSFTKIHSKNKFDDDK